MLLIRSGPEALFGSTCRFSITSLTSSSVISMLYKVASVSSVNGGSSACESSSEDTDAKKGFKESAFSSSVTCQTVEPAFCLHRGGMVDTDLSY